MSGGGGRYAVYFVPDPASLLAQLGAAWLGDDVASGASLVPPRLAGLSAERQHAITAEPRRYGFHATLKPPFALAEGCNAEALGDAVGRLAAGIPAFTAPPLRPASIAGFWALIPPEPCVGLDRLAAACVRELDGFRAPPTAAELARRRAAGLSPAQEALLERWGYPYVMGEFRFHLTLTARLSPEEGEIVRRGLAPLVEPLCRKPLAIDAISLLHQPRRVAMFRLVRRYPLG
jgi:putative phosphonate metabolism protein